MNGYIVKQSVIGLQDALEEIIKTTKSPYVRNYLKEILKLPTSEQEKWFLTSNQALSISRKNFDQERDVCTIIITVCTVVMTTIMVWNEIEKIFEEKEVEEEVCEEKKVEEENEENDDVILI